MKEKISKGEDRPKVTKRALAKVCMGGFFLFPVFLVLLWGCKKDYETSYKVAYELYSKNDVENLKKAAEKFDEAIRYAVMATQGKYEALMALGLVYKENQMYLDAAKAFQDAKEINPKDFRPHFELGWAYSNYGANVRGQEQEKYFALAEENFLSAYELRKDNDELNRIMGLFYGFMKKNPPKGIEHLKTVWDRHPEDYDTGLSLGTLYYEVGNEGEARQLFQLVATKAPVNSRARKTALENLSKLQNDLSRGD